MINKPVFRDPYLSNPNANGLGAKVTRKEAGFLYFNVKEPPVDAEAVVPVSTSQKVRRGILICLGIGIVAAAIIIGIYLCSNPENVTIFR